MAHQWQDEILMVVPSINGGRLLRHMLPTLNFKPANVVVLDQGSTDDTAEVCAEAGVVLVQLDVPHTYTQASNIGAELARERGAKYVCISNNDIAFRTDVLRELHAEMERDPKLGIVAPSQVIIDGKHEKGVLSQRVSWSLDQVAFLHDVKNSNPAVRRLESDFCELTCSLVRMAAIDEIGFLDDEFGFYHEDGDFAFRLRAAGYSCAYLPESQIDHFSSSTINLEKATRKAEYIRKNRIYFARKHLGFGVNHVAEPSWSRSDWGMLNKQLHSFLLRYGLLDDDAPDLKVSYPGVKSSGYLFTTSETIRNPSQWVEYSQQYKAIFTASPYARDLLAGYGIGNVHDIPLGIDPDIYNPWAPTQRFHDCVTYLAVVDGGQNRSLDAILKAWQQFRSRGRDARLLLLGRDFGDCMGHAPTRARRVNRFEISYYDEEQVDIYEILAPLPTECYAAFYCGVDYTIFGSGGEGAILPVLESMACGAPCIFGDYGSTAGISFEGALTFGGNAPPSGMGMVNRWHPNIGDMVARLEESFSLSRADRKVLADRSFYKVRGQATLQHTVMGLHNALGQLQVRDPSRFVRHLERSELVTDSIAGVDSTRAQPLGGLRGRLSRFTARRVSTVGHLTSQFGATWQERGFVAASRATADKLQFIVQRRSRLISRLGGQAAERVRATVGAVARPVQRRRHDLVPNSALLIGYIDAQLGLGQSLRGLALAMSQTPLQFSIYPFGVGVEGRRFGSYMPERYDQTRAHAVNVIEVTTDELPTVFAHVSPNHFNRSYNILRTYWELSKAPESWRPHLSQIDEIWAPNSFVAESFRSIFDGAITVVPPCVELPAVELNGRERFRLEDGVFYFLFSFDYYSFPERKNPQAVVRAFRRAFPDPSTPVGLIIKSTGAVDHHLAIKEDLRVAAQYDGRIDILDETLNRQEMLALIKASDCYVSLHRAEGFGFGMVEAMAMGKPVIGTDYSGSTDFLSENTGYPVPYRLRKVGSEEYVHAEGQVWADPSEAACAAAMASIFNDRQEALGRARHGRALVHDQYSPGSVGRVAEKRLNEIYQLLEEKARP